MSSSGAQLPASTHGNTLPLSLGGFFLVCLSVVSFGATIPGLHRLVILVAVCWISGGMLLISSRRVGNHRTLLWAFVLFSLAAAMFAAGQVDAKAWDLFGALALVLALALTRASHAKMGAQVD